VLCLAFAWIAWCTGMWLFQDRLIFPRELAPHPPAQRSIDAGNVITITTGTGKPIEGFFCPAPGCSAEHPAPAVLYFHGNAEIIDFQDRVRPMWERLGLSLLMAEYRGYGRAKYAGVPSQDTLVADGVRFYDELLRRPEVDRSRIVIHGYSIGGGVAAQVAARRKPAALILECTFTSVADFAWQYGVPPFLSRNPFHTDQVLPQLGVPIFLAHGRTDHIVPVSHGRRLHELVPASTYVELECGHLDMPGGRPEDAYPQALREFLVAKGISGDRLISTMVGSPAK
jgi:uncharacterized protein